MHGYSLQKVWVSEVGHTFALPLGLVGMLGTRRDLLAGRPAPWHLSHALHGLTHISVGVGLQTFAGRRRWLSNIRSPNYQKRSKAERQAVNTVCQVSRSRSSLFWNTLPAPASYIGSQRLRPSVAHCMAHPDQQHPLCIP